jgi:acetyl esterase
MTRPDPLRDPFLPLDRRFLDPAGVDQDTRDNNADVERRLEAAPARWEMSLEVERSLPYGGGALPASRTVDAAERRTIKGPGGELALQVLAPGGQPAGIYLHAHGGGWAAGSAFKQDEPLLDIVQGANVVAISVDYRLAPEHPYPAACADVEAVAKWVLDNAVAEFGAERIVIGGESAGAYLACVTILRMRSRHGYSGFAGANLSMGSYDLRLTPGARAWGERRLMLDTPTLRFQIKRFLAGADPDDPAVSPFLERDLSGLPPALFTVGTEDPLYEDSVFMYIRWASAGNDAQLLVFPGGMHGFPITATRLGRACTQAMIDFVARSVAPQQR